MLKIFCFALLSLIIHNVCFSQTYPIPEKTKRIVFLGNSITYNGKFISYVDTYLTLQHPDRKFEIINVGLPSETVSGLSEPNHADGKFPRPDLKERLQRILDQLNPDLVLANYGMNDGIYLPFDEERFEKFKAGMKWMHQMIDHSGSEIIHITPPVYDDRKGAAYANVLDSYSDWLISCRYNQNWQVIDLHGPMKNELENQRELNPEFAFAKDGIHPDEFGHFLIAKEILIGLGEIESKTAETIEELLGQFPHGMLVLKLVEQRQEIQRNAWLSQTGHQRPGLTAGLPLNEAEEKVAEIDLEIQLLLKKNIQSDLRNKER